MKSPSNGTKSPMLAVMIVVLKIIISFVKWHVSAAGISYLIHFRSSKTSYTIRLASFSTNLNKEFLRFNENL